MTEQTQTTAQRIQDMLDMNFNFYPGPPGVTAKTIAAEIERLTAEVASKQETIDMLLEDERDAFRHERAQLETQLAKARAEVERLRLPAEAWETQEHYDSLRVAPMADVLAADAAMKVAAARARKAANLKKLVAEQEQAAARARAAKETT